MTAYSYEDPPRIRGWSVEVSCPVCGGVLEHLADGRPTITSSRAVARCTACRRQYAAEVTLTDVTVAVGGDCDVRRAARRVPGSSL
jgi:hypothetical protein